MPKGFRIQFKKRRKKNKSPAKIVWSSAVNDKGKSQICIYAVCGMSDDEVGPIWGHSDAAVRRALATLTAECDCPARYHSAREFRGKRVVT